jgi:hypothetical protein
MLFSVKVSLRKLVLGRHAEAQTMKVKDINTKVKQVSQCNKK